MLDRPHVRRIRVLQGDVFAMLATLPDDHFDCVVTSPPYWGLRDYGVEGQIGLERTLGEHLDVMVRVFREVRRVLKPTGTLWLNYGDCYATSPNGRSAADTKATGNDDRTFRDKPFSTVGPINRGKRQERGKGRWGGGNNFDVILKPKDLAMVPNRVAIELQADGWWVRSEIIWHKPNPMPESIQDRPTSSHEKIWLLAKAERYFFDAEAISEAGSNGSHGGPKPNPGWKATTTGNHSGGSLGQTVKQRRDKQRGHSRRHAGFNDRWDAMSRAEQCSGKRNARNIWTIPPLPFPEAHFATFPPELVERCLKAGCPKGGHVLDPFGGSGTTALVADGLGMDCTLIELNPEYVEIASKRLGDMFRSVEITDAGLLKGRAV